MFQFHFTLKHSEKKGFASKKHKFIEKQAHPQNRSTLLFQVSENGSALQKQIITLGKHLRCLKKNKRPPENISVLGQTISEI